ncbi:MULTISPECIES: hypothetical protein [Mycobacteriaceae]|uniref:hypothetical protein n=1 Tax=Mycobacteriaceae TaxID=1762 RepID=UPI001E403062|nr:MULTISPECIES: hypothetical protein [Mycobacteriaceae]MDM2175059.1 hypothetical protein [Mycobacteroides abscessus]MDM2179758.1 hypothetical protein [Mycobacteroides abscessus]MDM2207811.1 hypothetical protein [Mycobacteroides abscessus]MDM2211443.1 hypothetical protein [Mycobacteroides abscessus]MDM2217743.1 hypothetical protein [Mycobacteroides abscessus]
MRMHPGWGYRRRSHRGAGALLLLAAALAAMAILGCTAELPRAGAPAPASGEHAPNAALGAVPGLITAHVHDVRADLDAPCPHPPLAGNVAGGDNAALKWTAPVLLTAGAMAVRAGAHGPPPWTRTAAAASGAVLLHQLCVIRR